MIRTSWFLWSRTRWTYSPFFESRLRIKDDRRKRKLWKSQIFYDVKWMLEFVRMMKKGFSVFILLFIKLKFFSLNEHFHTPLEHFVNTLSFYFHFECQKMVLGGLSIHIIPLTNEIWTFVSHADSIRKEEKIQIHHLTTPDALNFNSKYLLQLMMISVYAFISLFLVYCCCFYLNSHCMPNVTKNYDIHNFS